jgi:hypothetical protein
MAARLGGLVERSRIGPEAERKCSALSAASSASLVDASRTLIGPPGTYAKIALAAGLDSFAPPWVRPALLVGSLEGSAVDCDHHYECP